MKRWTCARTKSSKRSHVLLAFGSGVVVFCVMASLLLCPGRGPMGYYHPRGYAA
jgi:hypothetical protein